MGLNVLASAILAYSLSVTNSGNKFNIKFNNLLTKFILKINSQVKNYKYK